MKNMGQIIMVGPDPEGMGGISRVVKIYQTKNFFKEHNIKYIPSVSAIAEDRYIFLTKSLINFIYYCCKEYRVVYIHTASSKSFYRKCLFLLAAILFGKKIVLHIHPSFFITFLESFKGFKRKLFFFLLNQVDDFIVLTDEMKKNMKTLFPNIRVHILNNPVDLKAMINKNGIVRAKRSLLYLGWYIQSKGVYELVDAFEILNKRCEDVRIEFYGTKEIEKLRRYVEDKGLNRRISINGWIDDEKKLEALYRATMLILPSHTEGIPNVILEAMATKTPIVSTLVGGLKEILRDGENAIIAESKNPLNLSEKIIKCLQDDPLRHKISENAYKEVKEKYDLPIIKSEFLKIVRNI